MDSLPVKAVPQATERGCLSIPLNGFGGAYEQDPKRLPKAFNSIEWIRTDTRASAPPTPQLSIPLNGFVGVSVVNVVNEEFETFNSIEWIPSY